MQFGEAQEHLLTRRKLDVQGWTGRTIAAAVADGTLIRLHHGVYVPGGLWRTQFAEARHLLRVAAVQGSRDGGGAVLSHVSAAVAWGLPLYRLDPHLVHVSGGMVDGHTLSGRPRIARHEILVADADRTLVEGMVCTSLSRTVADVIRSLPIEAGISMADAAFRQVAWDETTHSYDPDAAAGFRDAVQAHMERHRRARGVRLGRRVLALADGRAELPGESVSRLRLIELGFAIAGLQTAIPAPGGGMYYVDFDLARSARGASSTVSASTLSWPGLRV